MQLRGLALSMRSFGFSEAAQSEVDEKLKALGALTMSEQRDAMRQKYLEWVNEQ